MTRFCEGVSEGMGEDQVAEHHLVREGDPKRVEDRRHTHTHVDTVAEE